MIMRYLMNKVAKTNRKIDQIRTAHYVAAGVSIIVVAGACVAAGIILSTKRGKEMREKMKNTAINKVEYLKDIVIKDADTVKASVVNAADKISSVIEKAQDKAEVINKEFSDGSEEIIKDVRETAENVDEEINK